MFEDGLEFRHCLLQFIGNLQIDHAETKQLVSSDSVANSFCEFSLAYGSFVSPHEIEGWGSVQSVLIPLGSLGQIRYVTILRQQGVPLAFEDAVRKLKCLQNLCENRWLNFGQNL